MSIKQNILLGLLALFTLCATELRAQQKDSLLVPDNEAIFRAIIDNDSPYYYPSLMGRYIAGDTTLNAVDFHHLYYGYAYQPTYKPLENSAATDRILMILEGNPKPTAQNFRDIIEAAMEVMRTEPFNPGTLNFLTYAYGALGDTINERINAYRMNMVLKTILSSGTGLSEESPWHTLYFSHPLDIYATMDLRVRKRMVISRSVEFLALWEPKGRIKGYYFDYGRVYWNRPDNISTPKNNGLLFNGITIKERK